MDGQPSEPQILLFYEFLYFFAHLTLRSGVARGLTASQVKKFQSYLGPLLASTAVDTFFLHWSTELKAKMMGEFFEKLNDAEIEYAECQGGLVSRDDPFSRDTLTGRLAVNVVELWERSGDQVAKTAVVSAVTGALKRVDLVRLVSEVVAKIDQVENEPGI